MNIHIPTWTAERIDQLRKLHAANLSFQEIGTAIGMTRSACRGKASRLGLPARLDWRYTRPSPVQTTPNPKPDNDLADSALHIAFLDLEPHHCRFPYGDGPFTFCGHPKVQGSYCTPHALYCTEARR